MTRITKPRRRDYRVMLNYLPAPGVHNCTVVICNAADREQAILKATEDFKAEHPGAEVVHASALVR